jgi:predicted translin family RNA/ssDNA-binding protein
MYIYIYIYMYIYMYRERMETYDKLREDVIKQSRDIQKLSKQAIYSVHRGALQDSRTKLDQAMVLSLVHYYIYMIQ